MSSFVCCYFVCFDISRHRLEQLHDCDTVTLKSEGYFGFKKIQYYRGSEGKAPSRWSQGVWGRSPESSELFYLRKELNGKIILGKIIACKYRI